MKLVFGMLSLALAAVLFAWACVQYRRPNPSRWTASDGLSNVIALLSVGGFAFGLAFLGHFAVSVGQDPPSLGHIAAAVAILAASAVPLAALRVQWRRLSTDAGRTSDGAHLTLVAGAQASDGGPGLPPRAGAAGVRKRARRRNAA